MQDADATEWNNDVVVQENTGNRPEVFRALLRLEFDGLRWLSLRFNREPVPTTTKYSAGIRAGYLDPPAIFVQRISSETL